MGLFFILIILIICIILNYLLIISINLIILIICDFGNPEISQNPENFRETRVSCYTQPIQKGLPPG